MARTTFHHQPASAYGGGLQESLPNGYLASRQGLYSDVTPYSDGVVEDYPTSPELVWNQTASGPIGPVRVLTATKAVSTTESQTPTSTVQFNPFTSSIDREPGLLAAEAGSHPLKTRQRLVDRHQALSSASNSLMQPQILATGSDLRRRSNPDDPQRAPERPAQLKRHITDSEVDRINAVKTDQEIKTPRSTGRVPHNLVERRYRDNLNHQIESLRLRLPSLKDAYTTIEDLEDGSTPSKIPSKAVIISTAATYIRELEADRSRLLNITKALQEQVSGLQKLLKCDDCSMLQYLNSMQMCAGQVPAHTHAHPHPHSHPHPHQHQHYASAYA